MSKHISIRVPWHDNGWNGNVCTHPERNFDCSRLKNIGDKRTKCQQHAGTGRSDWGSDFTPACLKENGLFLATEEHIFSVKHPYTFDTHFAHVLETERKKDCSSLLAIPYKWLMCKDDKSSYHHIYFTGFNDGDEVSVGKKKRIWISNGVNQKKILEYFWKDITPNKSIAVAYAKSIPITETAGRSIIAISRIKSLGEITRYEYSSEPDDEERLQAMCWERVVHHKLNDVNDREGFVLPFQQIHEYLKRHPETDPDDLLLIVPPEYQNDFSYGAEHISHEGMIFILNRAIVLLEKYRQLGFESPEGSPWNSIIKWCEGCLDQVWAERGKYPGLGNILSALGMPFGYDVCSELAANCPENEDLLDYVIKSFSNWNTLKDRINDIMYTATKPHTTDNFIRSISQILDDNRKFWAIVARVNASKEAAELLYKFIDDDELSPNERQYKWLGTIPIGDELAEKVENNPYILYERTRLLPERYRITITQIDLAFFQPAKIADVIFKNDEAILINEADDRRRLRALITMILEESAINDGHTMLPVRDVIQKVNSYRPDMPGIDVDIHVRKRALGNDKDFYEEMFTCMHVNTTNADGDEDKLQALKLVRLNRIDDTIRKFVDNRVNMSLYGLPEDREWMQESEDDRDRFMESIASFPSELKKQIMHKHNLVLSEQEVALEKIYTSPLSVLTGGAGTGKTYILTKLCTAEDVRAGGILILAPTGKARVILKERLRDKGIAVEALTVAKFLVQEKHSIGETFFPYLTGKKSGNRCQTVIIDESSMLTEENFGVLCELLADARRVIFAGDPDQLPPIGAGKPFYELCEKLSKEDGQPRFAKLTMSNRQRGSIAERGADEHFAKFFSSEGSSSDIEALMTLINSGTQHIKFLHCQSPEQLPGVLEDVMSDTFKFVNRKDKLDNMLIEFDYSLGGKPNLGWMNFDDCKGVEKWQILSPYRNREFVGSNFINQFIHDKFATITERGNNIKKQKIPPYGSQGIIKGEKIINLSNNKFNKDDVWNRGGIENPEHCTANGEIGITSRYDKYKHEILYSSQPGLLYKYSLPQNEDAPLELAYALTVHKAQGSGFDVTILVLIIDGYNSFISREMLYTALTRHRDKIFIITNLQPTDLLDYARPENSAIAKRLTSIFEESSYMSFEEQNGWYDTHLIHRAKDGKLLRSKSELIIYNMMLDYSLNPEYERPLMLTDCRVLPDFTISGCNGNDIYWEHLGMLGNTEYDNHWKYKMKLYASHGISEENGNLVISHDDPLNGSLDSMDIHEKIRKLSSLNKMLLNNT